MTKYGRRKDFNESRDKVFSPKCAALSRTCVQIYNKVRTCPVLLYYDHFMDIQAKKRIQEKELTDVPGAVAVWVALSECRR